MHDVIAAWDKPDAPLHPTLGTNDYWTSGAWWADYVAERVSPGATVLDFACGDGRVSRHLLDRGLKVTGFDTGSAQLARFRDKCPQATALSELTRTRYDVVIMLAVLIHYSAREGMPVLLQAWDCVKKGGWLMANVWLAETEIVTDPFTVNVWARESFELPGAEIISTAEDMVIARKR